MTSPAWQRSAAAYVTGEAAASLDERGLFTYTDPGADTLSEKQATSIATAWVHRFVRGQEAFFRKQSGVDFVATELHACGKAYLAQSVYLSPTGGSALVQRNVGPHWLLTLCTAGDQPVLSVSMNALAIELAGQSLSSSATNIDAGDFFAWGIGSGAEGYLPTPELAAQRAAELTGRRVSQVPRLIQPPSPYIKQLARWRVHLDSLVAVRGEHSRLTSEEQVLYVGWEPQSKAVRVMRSKGPATAQQEIREGIGGVVRVTRLIPRSGAVLETEPVTPSRAAVSP